VKVRETITNNMNRLVYMSATSCGDNVDQFFHRSVVHTHAVVHASIRNMQFLLS